MTHNDQTKHDTELSKALNTMTINSRTKGQTGEREVIKLIQPIINRVYDDARQYAPQLQRNTLQAHTGGFDIVGLDNLTKTLARIALGSAV